MVFDDDDSPALLGSNAPEPTDQSEIDIDLTPRAVDRCPEKRHRRWVAYGFLVILVGVFGFLVFKVIGEATVFFKNADEAVAEKADLGTDTFRLQGTVVPDSVVNTGTGVDFAVVYNDVTVDVVHTGAPPELFQDGMPVVLVGHWDGEVYTSDEILVRHDEVYVEENSDRISDANEAGEP